MASAPKPPLAHLMAEMYRLQLLRGLEHLLADCGYGLVAGVDEAGRGCLAGPVVAAAVVVDTHCLVPGVDDSKKLREADRERVAGAIEWAVRDVSVAAQPAEVIDRMNILEATRRAMCESLAGLSLVPDVALVDAVALKGFGFPCLPVIRGDAFSFAIACASVIAKTRRDRLMAEYDREFPAYGFGSNKGYGAQQHRQALAELGPTPIHRLTFRSVLPKHTKVRWPMDAGVSN